MTARGRPAVDKEAKARDDRMRVLERGLIACLEIERRIRDEMAELRCDHVWKVTGERLQGMWCKCEKCGATKEETWD